MAEREDPKVAALRSERSLNPRPERVLDAAFLSSGFFDARDLLQVKYELVRRVQVDAWSVTRAVGAFGFSRPSFYAAAAALGEAGLPGLLAERPGPKRSHKLGAELLAFVLEQLAAGSAERPRELVAVIEACYGVRVHPRSIERAVMRSRAQTSPRRGANSKLLHEWELLSAAEIITPEPNED
jgi:transposase